MNRKAQVGIVGAIFLFLIFIVLWFIFGATLLSNVGQSVIDEQHLTGVEAFFMANLNFIVFICCLLGMLGWMYFSNNG